MFSSRETREGDLAFTALQRFIHGLVVNETFVVPLPMIMLLTTTILVLVITQNIIEIGHINWFDKVVEYNFNYPGVIFSLLVIRNRQELTYIAESIDIWWEYPFLEKETQIIKKRAEAWLKRFTNAYYIIMVLGCFGVFFQPIGKYIWNGRTDLEDLLLFKCWSPVPLDTAWGLGIVLILEVASVYFLFFTYSAIATFMITMTMLFYYQTLVIGMAFNTIENRVRKVVILKRKNLNGTYRIYTRILQQEITNCARNYQNLYKYLQNMCKIINLTVNIVYYTGMLLLVTSGLQIVNKNTNTLVMCKAIMLISSVVVNQYLNSFITETLNEATSSLRDSVYSCEWYNMPKECQTNIHLLQTLVSYSPQLSTFLGAKCDKEFLSKVINTAYCYFNTLHSMRAEK